MVTDLCSFHLNNSVSVSLGGELKQADAAHMFLFFNLFIPEHIPNICCFHHLSHGSFLCFDFLQLSEAPKVLPPSLVSADFAANQLTTIYPYTFGQKPKLK